MIETFMEYREQYQKETKKKYSVDARFYDTDFITLPSWDYVCWLEGKIRELEKCQQSVR